MKLCLLELRPGVIDLRPSFRRGEREFIGSDTYGLAMLLVSGCYTLIQVSTGVVDRSRET